MRIEEKILIEENEINPNNYTAKSVLWAFVAMTIIEILNEVGAFHVELIRMRIGFVIFSLCCLLIHFLGFYKKTAKHPHTKYWILGANIVQTLAATIILSQWTELIVVFPLFVAMQYHNKNITRIAFIGTIVVALISAPLSVYLGYVQLDYYLFLIRSIGFKVEGVVVENPDYNIWQSIYETFKYMSIPRGLISAAWGILSIYMTNLISSSVKNRADAAYFSSTDVLTGALNRYSYEGKVSEFCRKRPNKLVCIYLDTDGLHALNNEQGHVAGDKMLKFCADQLTYEFGDCVYRVGGDEFIVFTKEYNEEEVYEKLRTIDMNSLENDYHMSYGVETLKDNMMMDDLIKEAEKKMFLAKKRYYLDSGKERRKN